MQVTAAPGSTTAVVSWSIDGHAAFVNTVASTGQGSSGSVPLTVGTWKVFKVTVTAQDDVAQTTYTVNVFRAEQQQEQSSTSTFVSSNIPVEFSTNANADTVSQGSFSSPDGSHHVLVAWVDQTNGVTCSVVGVSSSMSTIASGQISSTAATSVSIAALGYLPSDSSTLAAAACFIAADSTLYCGWVNVQFGEALAVNYINDSQVSIDTGAK